MIGINWFLLESTVLKPDWLEEIKSFSMKYTNRLLYIKRLKTIPQMGSKDTGR